uniref:VPS37 C-terminal domain-containing protein n=1 Tax=Tetradesmus obliquus TaxID=3088 RepID=A0A383VSW4_TETOB|eukprot:jgi/Sobl393_1/17130/SZX68271.1
MAGYPMYSPYGPLASERMQQIDELMRQFPGCRAINPDRSVFDLPLELKDKKTTALRITLPPHFPQERPGLSVLIPVAHAAVDPTGRLHTSLISSWVYGSSRLSSAVAEAVATLTDGVTDSRQSDPSVAAGTVPYPSGYPVPGGPLSQGRQHLMGSPTPGAWPGSGTGSSGSSPRRQQGPATSSTLPDWSRYSVQQLEELMNDQAAFKALLKEAVKGSPMAATLEEIREKNRQLAESNLSKQNAINEARNQLAVVRGSEYTLIKSRFDELYARQARVLSTMGGVVWREKLEEAVSAADSASSALAADFMAGDVALEEFVQQHLELRMQHHVLDLKRQAAEALLAGMAGSGGGAGGSGGGA